MKVIEVLWSESHNSQISGVSEHLMLIIPAPHSQPLGCPKTTDNVKPNGKCYTVTCDWLPMFIKFLIFKYIYHTLMGYLLQTKVFFCSFYYKRVFEWIKGRKHTVFSQWCSISWSSRYIYFWIQHWWHTWRNSSHLVSMPLMKNMFKLDLETFLMACYFY